MAALCREAELRNKQLRMAAFGPEAEVHNQQLRMAANGQQQTFRSPWTRLRLTVASDPKRTLGSITPPLDSERVRSE